MQQFRFTTSHFLQRNTPTAVQLACPTRTLGPEAMHWGAACGTHVVDVILRGSVGQTSHVDAVAGRALEGGRSVAVPVVRHPCGEKSPF